MEQESFNFLAAVTIFSDFGAPPHPPPKKIKSVTGFLYSSAKANKPYKGISTSLITFLLSLSPMECYKLAFFPVIYTSSLHQKLCDQSRVISSVELRRILASGRLLVGSNAGHLLSPVTPVSFSLNSSS